MTSPPLFPLRLDVVLPFAALATGQLLGSLLIQRSLSWMSGGNDAAIFFAAFPLLTILFCAISRFPARIAWAVVPMATLAALTIIHLLRRYLDSNLFFGPCPPEWELPGYSALAALTLILTAWTQYLGNLGTVSGRLRWMGIALAAVCLIGLTALLVNQSGKRPGESHLLLAIAQLEQQRERMSKQGSDLDAGKAQELSALLARAGRETEAESVSRWLFDGVGPKKASRAVALGAPGEDHPNSAPIDLARLKPLPWRETMMKIASQHQLILVMEAHNAPRHRQWIEQLLPLLREAGFRDYAAEGLAESGDRLKARGYPVPTSGAYVAEPHFANLLRRALDLDFSVHAYEAANPDFDGRESTQAANLAQLFAENPNLKLMVHVGYGHLFKTHREGEPKMMAAYLWEITGIEPFCIWQTFHSPDETDASQLAKLVPPNGDPVMLAPVPGGFQDFQFRYLSGDVDAVVIHPPSTGGPAQRRHGFLSTRKRIAGVWNAGLWPILIGVFKKGDAPNAIALDQVMLRSGERDFALWVTDDEFEWRVFGMNGQIPSTIIDGSLQWTSDSVQPRRPGS